MLKVWQKGPNYATEFAFLSILTLPAAGRLIFKLLTLRA